VLLRSYRRGRGLYICISMCVYQLVQGSRPITRRRRTRGRVVDVT